MLLSDLKKTVRPLVLPFHRQLYPRRFQAFCVGMGKTGTHSIDGLFRENYRSSHEPDWVKTIDMVLAKESGALSELNLRVYLRARDLDLWLEMESSNLMFHFLDVLLDEFPNSKFILTIRDPYTWLDSTLNTLMRKPLPPQWVPILELRFRREPMQFAPEEQVLGEYNLYPLAALLTRWTEHNRTVLNTVPPERLLVVRTDQIGQSLPTLAAFLDIPVETLNPERAHLFRTPVKYNFLAEIDREYLDEQIQMHCSELLGAYFKQ
jgi:hypothetical protein